LIERELLLTIPFLLYGPCSVKYVELLKNLNDRGG
jgi:hypothetical protein